MEVVIGAADDIQLHWWKVKFSWEWNRRKSINALLIFCVAKPPAQCFGQTVLTLSALAPLRCGSILKKMYPPNTSYWLSSWALLVTWWRHQWKHFPRYWPFVRGIHRSTVNSPHKGQWRGALMFSLICTWINGWVNNSEAGDLKCHRAYYNVSVLKLVPGECHRTYLMTSQHWTNLGNGLLPSGIITWPNFDLDRCRHMRH